MFDRQPAGGDKSTAAAAPKDFVRTHAADQKMDRFLVTKNAGTAAATPGEPEKKGKSTLVAGSGGSSGNQECQLTSVKTLRQQLQVRNCK